MTRCVTGLPGICEYVDERGVRCGHLFEAHEGAICKECDGGEIESRFHAYEGPRLAGGTYTPNAEKDAYDRAMRGVA